MQLDLNLRRRLLLNLPSQKAYYVYKGVYKGGKASKIEFGVDKGTCLVFVSAKLS